VSPLNGDGRSLEGRQLSLKRGDGPGIGAEPGLCEGASAGLLEGVEQAVKMAAAAERQDELTGLGGLALGWQTVIVNAQVETQGAQVFAIKVVEDKVM